MPWGLLGHSQLGVPGVAQLALVGGVPVVSALLGAIHQALATAATERTPASRRVLASCLAAWLALALVGLPLAHAVRPAAPPGERREPRGERPAIREVLLATRRLGRALGRLGAEEITSEDRQRLARALRRTERVVQRRLALLEASTL